MKLWQRSMIALARNQSLKGFMQSRAAMSELAMRLVGGRDVAEAAERSLSLRSVAAYAAWGYLLQRYSTGAVAPFALVAPCVGVVASVLIFGELPSPVRYAGMALILAGLAIVVLPAERLRSLLTRAQLSP